MLPQTKIPAAIEQIPDRQQLAVQANTAKVRQAVNDRGPTPITTGPVVFAGAVSVVVNHRLGRKPMGWSQADITGGYGPVQRTAWDDKTITFLAFSGCTVTFEVW